MKKLFKLLVAKYKARAAGKTIKYLKRLIAQLDKRMYQAQCRLDKANDDYEKASEELKGL